MAALRVIGIILLIFLLIGFLRIGAVVSFGDALSVRLRIGHLKVTIIPGKEKKPKERKPKEEKPKKPSGEKKKKSGKASFPRPTAENILDLIQTSLSALGAMARRTCRRIRIDPLAITVVFGGCDPAEIAMVYGAASSLMFATMPRAEERFDIPDPSIHLRMDYGSQSTTVDGSLGLSVRVCDLFAILFTLIAPLAKWFLRFKKLHKHDVPSHIAEKRETSEQNTEDKIA